MYLHATNIVVRVRICDTVDSSRLVLKRKKNLLLQCNDQIDFDRMWSRERSSPNLSQAASLFRHLLLRTPGLLLLPQPSLGRTFAAAGALRSSFPSTNSKRNIGPKFDRFTGVSMLLLKLGEGTELRCPLACVCSSSACSICRVQVRRASFQVYMRRMQ